MMRWLLWWKPPALLRQVIVNLVDDPAYVLRGVLWSSRGAWLTLRDPAILKPATAPVSLDGDVVIHRARVAFLQVLP
jgi:hypothetical protein